MQIPTIINYFYKLILYSRRIYFKVLDEGRLKQTAVIEYVLIAFKLRELCARANSTGLEANNYCN